MAFLISNWQAVATKSISFLSSSAATVVGTAAAIQQIYPTFAPFLPASVSVPVTAGLAFIAAFGRLINQGIAPAVPSYPPAKDLGA